MSDTPSPHAATGRLAVRNTLWLALFSYGGQFISFVAVIVLTRRLGPEVFGLFAIGVFWASLLNLRPKFGLTYAAIRQPLLDGTLLGSYYGVDLGLTVLSLVIGIGAAFVLPLFGYASAVSVVVVVLLLADALPALVGPLGVALERELQFSRLTIVFLVASVLGYGTAILLAYASAGIWSLLAINVVSSVVTTIGVFLVARWRLPWVFALNWRFRRPDAEHLVRQGIPIGVSTTGFTTVVTQYDNFLIGTFVSPTTLGYYDRAYRISQWPNILLTSVLQRVGFVTFSRVQNDVPRLTHALRLSMWVITLLGVPMALGTFFGAPDIVVALYGPDWLPSAEFLRYLAIFSLVTPFISLGSSLAYTLGDMRTTLWISGAQAATIVILATPLTMMLGAQGTMLGVAATVAVGFLVSMRYTFRRLPLTVSEVFRAPTIAGLAATLVGAVLAHWLPAASLPPWVHLVLILGGIGVVYLGTLVLLTPHETMSRIRYLVATFRGRRVASS